MTGDPETMPADIEHLDRGAMLDALDDLHAVLAGPGAWTRGATARDRDGTPVDPLDPAACRWCVTGAARLVEHRRGLAAGALRDVLDAEARRRGRGAVDHVNDSAAGVGDVLTFVARARHTVDIGL